MCNIFINYLSGKDWHGADKATAPLQYCRLHNCHLRPTPTTVVLFDWCFDELQKRGYLMSAVFRFCSGFSCLFLSSLWIQDLPRERGEEWTMASTMGWWGPRAEPLVRCQGGLSPRSSVHFHTKKLPKVKDLNENLPPCLRQTASHSHNQP